MNYLSKSDIGILRLSKRLENLATIKPELVTDIEASINKYKKCFWEDVSPEDIADNKKALKTGEGVIIGKYEATAIKNTYIGIATESTHKLTLIFDWTEYDLARDHQGKRQFILKTA